MAYTASSKELTLSVDTSGELLIGRLISVCNAEAVQWSARPIVYYCAGNLCTLPTL